MIRRDSLTKILATGGTVLAWLPIAATLVFTLERLLQTGIFRMDYLLPAELFPVAAAGGGLLLWAALRARSRVRLVAWGLGGMLGMLLAGQALAVVTGLASGETEPAGLSWALVVASLALYTAALVELGIAGLLLLRDLFRPADQSNSPVLPNP